MARTRPGRRPLFLVEGRNCEANLLVHLETSVLLQITKSSKPHCKKVNIGRRHRKVRGKHYLPMVNTLFVGGINRASEGKMPFIVVILHHEKAKYKKNGKRSRMKVRVSVLPHQLNLLRVSHTLQRKLC